MHSLNVGIPGVCRYKIEPIDSIHYPQGDVLEFEVDGPLCTANEAKKCILERKGKARKWR